MAKKRKLTLKSLRNKRIAFFGEFAVWPTYHGGTPGEVATRHGARTVAAFDAELDFLVIGDKRGTGRADAKKRAERLNERNPGSILVLGEAEYREIVRVDVTGKTFAFCGGFDCCPNDFVDDLLTKMVDAVGASVQENIDERLDYLVVGNRRGKGKTAAVRQFKQVQEDGGTVAMIGEEAFLELVRKETVSANEGLTFATFVGNLYGVLDEKRIQRAMKMLQTQRFSLYSIHDQEHLVGIVKSQTRDNMIYAPHLDAKGRYGCVSGDLADCMGLQGQPCKHLMVLLLGLVQAGELDVNQAWTWISATSGRRPKRDEEHTTEALLQYKGVIAGEVDWRPTETIPEDYYML